LQSVVEVLLSHGADANANDLLEGSALQAACRSGNEGVVGLLLDHGANVTFASASQGSSGALQLSSIHGETFIVEMLLKHIECFEVPKREDR
jgi:ankyrin repeat protein